LIVARLERSIYPVIEINPNLSFRIGGGAVVSFPNDRTAVGLKFYLVGGGREKILKLDELASSGNGSKMPYLILVMPN